MQPVFDIALIALLVSTAAWSIFARESFSAIVIFMAYGLLLALAWVRLSAVDVALTEAAIGSGVTGMLLLNAAAVLRSTEKSQAATPRLLKIAAGVFSATVAALLAGLVIFHAGEPVTLAPLAMAHLAESGLGNPVAGVLFVYRSIDTLLEKVVLLLALIGVWSLASDRLWGGIPGLRVFPQRDSILIFLAQTLPPIGIMFAVYQFWAGASVPGGAFQGGTVLAAMWILVMIAGLRDVPSISSRTMRIAAAHGPVIFLLIGLAGIVLAGSFLAYPAGHAKPLIVVVEATLTLSIGVTLGLLAAGPPAREARR
jgi:multisubunit Na+/H+ antiporter MnhB subunit